jgi:hypothetical protein
VDQLVDAVYGKKKNRAESMITLYGQNTEFLVINLWMFWIAIGLKMFNFCLLRKIDWLCNDAKLSWKLYKAEKSFVWMNCRDNYVSDNLNAG